MNIEQTTMDQWTNNDWPMNKQWLTNKQTMMDQWTTNDGAVIDKRQTNDGHILNNNKPMIGEKTTHITMHLQMTNNSPLTDT